MRRAALLLLLLGFAPSRASASCDDHALLHLRRANLIATPQVTIYLDDTDGEGRFCTGRERSDFKLAIDSAEQYAALDEKPFVALGRPIYLVVVAERAGMSDAILDGERRGVRAIVESSARLPRSQVMVPLHLVDLDGARESLITFAVDEKATLADQVRAAIDRLSARVVPDDARKLIVVVSDGSDDHLGPRKMMTELGKRALLANIAIDTVDYGGVDSRSLRELPRQSNGTARNARSSDAIAPQLEQVAAEVTGQYVLRFLVPDGLEDGKDHTLQVTEERNGKIWYSNSITEIEEICDWPPADQRPFFMRRRIPVRAQLVLYSIIPIALLILALRSRRRPR